MDRGIGTGAASTVELLGGAVRSYAWGSRTAIAALTGAPVPAPHPQAELWLGAHPGDPSVLHHAAGGSTSLLDVLRADPVGQLGAACAQRWGDRLPFLLKVLAAEEPLSLQAHPSAAQAEEGYAREEARGVPIGAPERNYRDPHHKPELLCALTEFHALAGFRPAHRSLELLRALDVAELAPYRDLLAAQPDADGLRALFTTLITLPQSAVAGLLAPLPDACVRLLRRHDAYSPECRVLLQLTEAHPGDAGVLAALLLNYVVLAPGEGLYLAAGNLHTYLQGTGVEIMASSDNVLRGGLTPKHVDVPELLRVLDFTPGELVVHRGESAGPRETGYPTPAAEFRLSRLDWTPGDGTSVPLRSTAPQILLCTAGSAQVQTQDGQVVALPCGNAVWLPAHGPDVTVCAGPAGAQVFRAIAGPGL